ncbi:MAG: Cysteine desulfurase IscS [Candidatus Anoxychlamydiales bacterium]|nr:Cysteine desulfurase IscS [Candidatus Anoxychlamydiales bacterium]
MIQKIYLDNNATTQMDKEVFEAMNKLDYPANPSSTHFYGKMAKKELQKAKENIASYLKVKPRDLIFTSGGTEAVNIGIRSLIEHFSNSHIIASDIDHSCVYNTLEHLEKKGFDISFVDVKKHGAINPEQIEPLIKENTKLIVISAVNSETGVKTDIETIAKIAKNKNIYLFVDAVALLGKENFSIPKGTTSMAFSAHKMHGPTGIGLCYFKHNVNYTPLLFGGPQEDEKRAGTQNMLGIVGFSKAIDLLKEHLPKARENMLKLREHFEKTLIENLKNISINGEGPRICNTSNICFKNVDAESLLILLDRENILASHGSACSSGSIKPSRVLLNMGINPKDVRSSIRFSFSRNTTKDEIDKALKIIIRLVKKLKS